MDKTPQPKMCSLHGLPLPCLMCKIDSGNYKLVEIDEHTVRLEKIDADLD